VNRQWVAEPDGRDARHPGELSSAEKREQARHQHQLDATLARAQKRAQCLSNAHTAQAAQRCLNKFPP
jgi:hypothetical protein